MTSLSTDVLAGSQSHQAPHSTLTKWLKHRRFGVTYSHCPEVSSMGPRQANKVAVIVVIIVIKDCGMEKWF